MEAVVMAAGEGVRMRPLTERWAKPVLPIAGKPVIATLLHELRAAGTSVATVVVGHLAEQIEDLVGDGAPFGLDVRYAHQPEPLGPADALSRALAAGARPPLLVTAADTVYRAGDLGTASAGFLEARAPGGLGVREVRPADLPKRYPVAVDDGRVVQVVPKPAPGPRPLVAAPLWFFADGLVDSLASVPGPPFELADAFQGAIDTGERIVALELGPTRDITRPEDVIAHNFPYLSRWG
ncbi:MAG TPA: sugar phosphate nucleotidyltransferase [Gaiellaceae bacterium]|nr:sugar phosphate nucleotidyltransferase [Gaiellaceae bacterium]